MSRPGWFRKQQEADGTSAGKRSWRRGAVVTASGAALVLVAGVSVVAFAAPGSHAAAAASTADRSILGKTTQTAAALQVTSVSPAAGAKDVNGIDPIRVQFSAPLAANSPMPKLSPTIAGSWSTQGDTVVFTPTVGFFQNTKVTVTIPAGLSGVVSAAGATAGNGGTLSTDSTTSFTTASFSTLRVQQLLAQLGYLPMTWQPTGAAVSTSDAKAQLAAAYNAPAGSFTWESGYPSELTSQWDAGSYNMLEDGAIRAFESVSGLTMDGDPGYNVWTNLFTAVAKDQRNPNGYTYALAQQGEVESLRIWHNGQIVLDSPANTGIPASPTVDGTFAVYSRFYFTYMKGTNPDGTPYDDPVYYVSYFNGGDAVHYFPRAAYGFYQSLGCVELPWDSAARAWPYLVYGTLVTVQGPVA